MSFGFKFAIKNKGVESNNPDDFTLFVDQNNDYVLLKEGSRGLTNVAALSTKTIRHGLNYIPFCLIFKLQSNGIWKKIFGYDVASTEISWAIDTENLVVTNNTASAATFQFFIFYDNFQS